MQSHPNAVVASGVGGVGVFIVWLLGYLGLDVSAEVGAVIAAGIVAFVLLLGREGFRGLGRRLWRGQGI